MGFFGDSLWVMDGDAYRVSYFDLDGAFLGSVTPRVVLGSVDGGSVPPPRPQRPLRDGTLLGESPAFSHLIATGEVTGTPVVHTDAAGATLARVWMRPQRTTYVLALLNEDGPGGSFGRQPFGDRPLSSMTENGYLVVDRHAHEGEGPGILRLTLIGLAGDTLIDHATRYETERLPSSVVDSVADARGAGMHSFMSRRDPGLALGAVQAVSVERCTLPPSFPRSTRWSSRTTATSGFGAARWESRTASGGSSTRHSSWPGGWLPPRVWRSGPSWAKTFGAFSRTNWA